MIKKYTILLLDTVWFALDIETGEFGEMPRMRSNFLVITSQSSDFTRHCKTNKWPVPQIVDLEGLDKQMSQEGKDIAGKKKWRLLEMLRRHKFIDIDFKLTQETVKDFLEHVAAAYTELLERDSEEKLRFEGIEVAVNKVIYSRQILGINIDVDLAKSRCARLEKEIYDLKNQLQFDFNIFQPDNELEQIHYLRSKKVNIIESTFYTFETRRKNDRGSNLFYELIRSKQDLDSLLYILSRWGGEQVCYPKFLGFGTITSRIILKQPSLQTLRRENRDIIIPSPGFRFLYIDYSQFEAGILASLSGDERLISIYNNDDIYGDFAAKILMNKGLRSEAKIFFYRYMYGDDSLNKVTRSYFDAFPKVKNFKTALENEMRDVGRVGSVKGNFRKSQGEDWSWALSHRIQSTASLIYKLAVAKVANEIKIAEFLIPMHDATLYQIPFHTYDGAKEKIEAIYKHAFKTICPQIDPKVTCKEQFI